MIESFSLSDVKLLDIYLSNALNKETEYLRSLDCDRLLSFFRKTRGLEPKAENYAGWENTEIRGHTLGHYLTAAAQAYVATKDITLYNHLQYLIAELSLCQFESGYLSAFPEEFFDRVEKLKPVWVPWYTMHKIISGLLSAYQFAKIEKALCIVSKIGDWVYDRTDKWTPEIRTNVLSVEYGGMNDCMYELYKITKNEKYAAAAHKFDDLELFSQIHDGKDVLNNRHANTTIPKFIGALKRYEVYGERESYYLDTCIRFWDIVVNHHSYVTGGNSESEHFGEADILDAERTSKNCETCNTYNMLKLTRGLFQITGERKYADFYEKTYFNAILSSQNPSTGTTMYFQPMATGYFKVYNRPFDDFWCCTGTGMENFSKLNDSLYFHDDEKLFVNLYVSSSVYWSQRNAKITQKTNIPNSDDAIFTIGVQHDTEFTLCLRIPDWSKGAKIAINGCSVPLQEKNGYVFVRRLWKNCDILHIRFEIEVRILSLPDNKNSLAFTYGPLVLSAGLGTENMEESITGISVRIPTKHLEIKDYIVCKGQTVEKWKKNIKNNLIKADGKLEFRLIGTDEDERLLFTPYFCQHAQRYGIYWIFVDDNSVELQKYLAEKRRSEAFKAAEIDSVQIGNDQYELSHHIKGKETESGDREGFHFRFAKPNGWFSYELKRSSSEETYLQIQYIGGGKDGFDIYADDFLLAHEKCECLQKDRPVAKTFLLPKGQMSEKVTIKFIASADQATPWLVDTIRTTKRITCE